MFEWQLAGKSDVGLVRELNEDCIHTNQESGFVILADGMGGHKGGEIASAMAVSGIAEDLKKAASNGSTTSSQDSNIADVLTRSVEKVNKEIYLTAQNNEHYQGMGTTIVVAITHGSTLHYAHVGDSRLYRLRNNVFEQLTSDHSLVNELLAQGYYKTQEEAANAGQKNIITRAVGINESVQVDVAKTAVEENDIYLLCSDGLSDMISNETIAELLQKHRSDLTQALDALIAEAKDAGGRDNVSVILMQVGKGSLLKKSLKWLFKS